MQIYIVILFTNIIFLDRMIGKLDTTYTYELTLVIVHAFVIGSVATTIIEEWRNGKGK